MSGVLVLAGLVLALDLPPKFGLVFSAPEWGYTLFSLGADIAIVYLIIDRLLLREESQLWKVVKDRAIGLVQAELKVVLLVVFNVLVPPIRMSSSKEEKMSRMRELATDLPKARNATNPLSADLSSAFDQLARDAGDLEHRYASRLDPRLIRILIDIEAALGSISATSSIVKVLSEEDAKDEVAGAFMILIKALVEAVDGGFVELT